MTDQGSESGLNIFFDQSGETGFRQVRFGGYDRHDVDVFVAEAERRIHSQQQRVARLEAELAEAQRSGAPPSAEPEPDQPHQVGSRIGVILDMAAQQGRQITEAAEGEAARIVAAGRRQAQELVLAGEREAEDVRLTTTRHATTQQERLERESGDVVARAGAEAELLLDRARQHAAVVEHDAEVAAAQAVEAGHREADVVRQQAATEAAEHRLEAEQRRHDVLVQLQGEHEQARQALAATTGEHTAERERAGAELAEVVAAAARIRAEAISDADEARTRALRDTETQIATAHQQQQVGHARNLERHQLKIETLRREIASLQQRRLGIVAQLSHLSAVVTATAGQFGEDSDVDLDAELEEVMEDVLETAPELDAPDPDPATADSTEDEQEVERAAEVQDESDVEGDRGPATQEMPAVVDESDTDSEPTQVLPAVGGGEGPAAQKSRESASSRPRSAS